jgi:hypothetical protein
MRITGFLPFAILCRVEAASSSQVLPAEIRGNVVIQRVLINDPSNKAEPCATGQIAMVHGVLQASGEIGSRGKYGGGSNPEASPTNNISGDQILSAQFIGIRPLTGYKVSEPNRTPRNPGIASADIHNSESDGEGLLRGMNVWVLGKPFDKMNNQTWPCRARSS